METNAKKSGKKLKELIIINNDRYEGYKTAAEETQDTSLKNLFVSYSNQSKLFSDELQGLISDYSESPDEGETKTTGKLYRIFMDMKAAIGGNNRKGILSSCEFGEDTAKKTYDDVLKDTDGIANEAVQIISKQRGELQKSHDKIKAMRDSA